MKTTTKSRFTIAAALLAVATVLSTGCASLRPPEQPVADAGRQQGQLPMEVYLQALAAQAQAIPQLPSENTDKGFIQIVKDERFVHHPDGQVYSFQGPNGETLHLKETSLSQLRLNSYYQLGGDYEDVMLQVGQPVLPTAENGAYSGMQPMRGGLLVHLQKGTGGVSVNADAILAHHQGRALQKGAQAQAAATALQAWSRGHVDVVGAYTDGTVRVLTTTGELVTGVLKRLSPIGAATADAAELLDLVLETPDGERQVRVSQAQNPEAFSRAPSLDQSTPVKAESGAQDVEAKK